MVSRDWRGDVSENRKVSFAAVYDEDAVSEEWRADAARLAAMSDTEAGTLAGPDAAVARVLLSRDIEPYWLGSDYPADAPTFAKLLRIALAAEGLAIVQQARLDALEEFVLDVAHALRKRTFPRNTGGTEEERRVLDTADALLKVIRRTGFEPRAALSATETREE